MSTSPGVHRGFDQLLLGHENYRGTSLIGNNALLWPYSRTMSRALWWFHGGGLHPTSPGVHRGFNKLLESGIRSPLIIDREVF